jgi:hypothetical protein
MVQQYIGGCHNGAVCFVIVLFAEDVSPSVLQVFASSVLDCDQ